MNSGNQGYVSLFSCYFSSIKLGARHPAISEHVILPCLRIISQVAGDSPPPDGAKGRNCIMKDMYGITFAYKCIQLSGWLLKGFIVS
ncbi:hypothetical protein GIB67_006566 [Kingdonia uniflora]|uniref:Uncharacterized protein n=1 Tax=Kingdonia uniflora TaxID=39325 RepID=A0A7J7LEM6_9MAGN|nr:hypothetical protein GIB67_006566 [Kingdonia uniflora]